MDIKEIKKLLDLMARNEVSELEIEESGKRIRIKFKEGLVSYSHPQPPNFPQPQVTAPIPEPTETKMENQKNAVSAPEGTIIFKSPMVGTFYRASAPGAEPFVKKFDKIKAGTTLCIIEAMKVMNEIKSEIDAEVVDILVKNEEPVEYGQPLFILRPL